MYKYYTKNNLCKNFLCPHFDFILKYKCGIFGFNLIFSDFLIEGANTLINIDYIISENKNVVSHLIFFINFQRSSRICVIQILIIPFMDPPYIKLKKKQ